MTIELGQVAYESYRTCSDGKSLVSGATLPDWSDLDPKIREAWRASADGVKMWLESAHLRSAQ
jgi:hypothetical protein